MAKNKKIIGNHELKHLAFEYFKIVIRNRIEDEQERKRYIKDFQKGNGTQQSYIQYIKLLLNNRSSVEEMCDKVYRKNFHGLSKSSHLREELPLIKNVIDDFVKKHYPNEEN